MKTKHIIREAIAKKKCPVCGKYIRNAAGLGSHLGAHARNDNVTLKVIRIVGEPQNSKYRT